MNKKGQILDIFIFLVLALIIYLAFFMPKSSVQAPVPPQDAATSSSLGYEELPDPVQTPYRGNKVIPYSDKNLILQIYPKANYRIYAMVMSKRDYGWDRGWNSKLAPYDLALAWNQLMLPQNQKGIKYSQSNRWYHYRYEAGYPLSQKYVSQHSANNHMIPANANLKKALDVIKKGDKVYFEGYLVSIKGNFKNGKVWWNSSLSRNDKGDGACEVFYFTKAVVKGVTYQ